MQTGWDHRDAFDVLLTAFPDGGKLPQPDGRGSVAFPDHWSELDRSDWMVLSGSFEDRSRPSSQPNVETMPEPSSRRPERRSTSRPVLSVLVFGAASAAALAAFSHSALW